MYLRVEFQKKPSVWESVSFHSEKFHMTSFGLVLRICIVNALINIDKLVQDQLLQFVKNHQYDKGTPGFFIVCSKVVLFMVRNGFLHIFFTSSFPFGANFQHFFRI